MNHDQAFSIVGRQPPEDVVITYVTPTWFKGEGRHGVYWARSRRALQTKMRKAGEVVSAEDPARTAHLQQIMKEEQAAAFSFTESRAH